MPFTIEYLSSINSRRHLVNFLVNGHLLMAASVMASVPLLLVNFFIQKKFIEGVATTGLK
ncbi:hypothetical protein [Paenibacillus ferrarius]|uniref:hypothetical protein n=1 Tax=Paenibacillus ferrarius TaxID=1469647 RepID=UPI003D2B8DA9